MNLEQIINPDIRADIQTKIDPCAFRAIKAHLKINGGEIEIILVADNGMELADLGALCVLPKIKGDTLGQALIQLREEGKIKQIILGPIRPEMRKYGWGIDDIADDEAIDAFYAPPIYLIKFRGHRWN